MTANEISEIVEKDCRVKKHKYTMSNFFFVAWAEMDVFSLTQANKVYEFEIKTSRSDFFADFKKVKKHEKIKAGEYSANRFYYVVPEGMVKVEEVPQYAGLIFVTKRGVLRQIKSAPLISKKDFSVKAVFAVASKAYWRYVSMRRDFDQLQKDSDRFKTLYNNLLSRVNGK